MHDLGVRITLQKEEHIFRVKLVIYPPKIKLICFSFPVYKHSYSTVLHFCLV